MKYVLDSNVCIHFMKDEYKVKQKLTAIGFKNCYISELTILELIYGIANSASTRKIENQHKLNQFIAGFQDRILPIRPVFGIFADQKTRLRKLGLPISDFDLLIGCTALFHGYTLSSRNIKEMIRIEGLLLENWID